MNNKVKNILKEGLCVLTVLLVIAGIIWGAMYFTDLSDQKNCEARHRTSSCLTRLLEEVKAKEAYEEKVKELNK